MLQLSKLSECIFLIFNVVYFPGIFLFFFDDVITFDESSKMLRFFIYF